MKTKILFLTVVAVFRRAGINASAGETMGEFKGTAPEIRR